MPMAMELPPVAVVCMSVPVAPVTMLLELPRAILPPLLLPVVVACPPKAMSPALRAVLPAPTAVDTVPVDTLYAPMAVAP